MWILGRPVKCTAVLACLILLVHNDVHCCLVLVGMAFLHEKNLSSSSIDALHSLMNYFLFFIFYFLFFIFYFLFFLFFIFLCPFPRETIKIEP